MESSLRAEAGVADRPGFLVEVPGVWVAAPQSFSGRHKAASLCLLTFSLVAEGTRLMQSPECPSNPEM